MFSVKESEIKVANKVLNNKKAIVRTDTDACIGIVGKGYKVVDDLTIHNHFKKITDKLGSLLKWDIKKFHEIRGGEKTITEIEFPNITKNIDKKDKLILTGNIINGYNGFSSAKLILGFYRTICKNGLIIGQKDLVIGYRHVGLVNEKLIEQFEKYIKEKTKEAITMIIAFTKLKFDNADSVGETVDSSLWIPEKYKELVFDSYYKEEIASDLSYWKLFNAFTYVITHHMKVNHETRLNYLRRLHIESQQWGL